EVPAEAWERVVKVNLLGTAAVVRAALPWLERSRGAVVTVASTLGLRAVSDATAYCASKFGVVGFTRALAAETAGRIGVTLLVPGGMDTAFFDGRDEQYKPPPEAALNRPTDGRARTPPPPPSSRPVSRPAARSASCSSRRPASRRGPDGTRPRPAEPGSRRLSNGHSRAQSGAPRLPRARDRARGTSAAR